MPNLHFFHIAELKGQDFLSFPARVYTEKEVRQAKALIDKGYKHRLRITGTTDFRQKVKQALALLKTAGYYDFFRTYLAKIMEIDGLTQLRQSEAALWLNKYAVKNTVDAASLFVQKANLMKEYLEGTLYYGGQAEKRSGEKRIKFLEELKLKSREKSVVKECERLVQMWKESSLVY
jgi:hypothetical protein